MSNDKATCGSSACAACWSGRLPPAAGEKLGGLNPASRLWSVQVRLRADLHDLQGYGDPGISAKPERIEFLGKGDHFHANPAWPALDEIPSPPRRSPLSAGPNGKRFKIEAHVFFCNQAFPARAFAALDRHHNRTHAAQQTAMSFDHLVGRDQQRVRHGEAHRHGGLHVDNQLDLGRRLHRQITRFLSPQNAIDIGPRKSERIVEIRPLGHKTAFPCKNTKGTHHRHPVAGCELGQKAAMRDHEGGLVARPRSLPEPLR